MSLVIINVSLFGVFQVSPANAAIAAAPRLQQLIAYLTAAGASGVNRSQTAADLFAECGPDQARTYLRQSIQALRKALPNADDHFELDGARLRATERVTSDLATFRAYRATNPVAAIAHYAADLASTLVDDWAARLRETLRDEFGDALQRAIEIYDVSGAHADACACALRWIRHEPLYEPAYVVAMRHAALSGDRAGVARIFRSCAHTLRIELGVAPCAATEHAYKRYLAVDTARLCELPRISICFGREQAIAQINTLWASGERLVTIHGPGGIGKTHLAVTAARAQHKRFAHGAHWASLVSAANELDVWSEIARVTTLNALPGLDLAEQVTHHLANREILLLLDNCEHLIAHGLPGIVARLLDTAPDLRILATSRQVLSLQHEYVLPIDGLDRASSAQVFQRVAHRLGAAATSEDEPESLSELIELTGGMPLALTLAASARVAMGCAEIVRTLKSDIDMLQIRFADAPERHRTLRATFTWSWQRLDGDARRAFSQASVFRDGFDRDAALAIFGAHGSGSLDSLVRASMITRVDDRRFAIHELLRQFGAEARTADSALDTSAREKHLAYFARVIEREYDAYQADRLGTVHDGGAADFQNVAAAWRYLLEQRDLNRLNALANPLLTFCVRNNMINECAQLMREASAMTAELPSDDPDAMAARVRYMLMTADTLVFARQFDKETEALFANAVPVLRMVGAEDGLMFVLCDLGQIALANGRVAEAIALLEEAVVLRRKHLASPMVALALNHLAAAHIADGGADSLEHAARALSEADAIVTAAHDRWQIGAIMITRGKLALRRGDAAGARAMFERALGVLAYQHAHIESGRALEALADLERAAGDLDAWRERLIMAQLVYLERGHTHLAQAIDVRLAASRV